jgi:hypothetical protein
MPQSRNIIAREFLHADVAGFVYRHCTEDGCKIAGSRIALSGVNIEVNLARAAISSKISGRYTRGYREFTGHTQANEALRIVQSVEASQDQFFLVA